MVNDDPVIPLVHLPGLLRVSKCTVYRFAKDKRFPIIQFARGEGYQAGVRLSALLEWFNRGREGQTDVLC